MEASRRRIHVEKSCRGQRLAHRMALLNRWSLVTSYKRVKCMPVGRLAKTCSPMEWLPHPDLKRARSPNC